MKRWVKKSLTAIGVLVILTNIYIVVEAIIVILFGGTPVSIFSRTSVCDIVCNLVVVVDC